MRSHAERAVSLWSLPPKLFQQSEKPNGSNHRAKSAKNVQESVAYLLYFHHGNLEAALANARESLASAHYQEDKHTSVLCFWQWLRVRKNDVENH